jgi:hypothetical protein
LVSNTAATPKSATTPYAMARVRLNDISPSVSE